jgi:hypothetical protein
MRIKYDFEDEYKGVELGEKLDGLLYSPKKFIETKLTSILTDIEKEEAINKDAHILIGGIKDEEPSISIMNYSPTLRDKINNILTIDVKMYLLTEIEEIVQRNFK